jgi:hypothetical protein
MPHRFQLEIEFIRLKEERLLKKHIEQTHVFQTRKFNFKQKRQDILAFPVRREKKAEYFFTFYQKQKKVKFFDRWGPSVFSIEMKKRFRFPEKMKFENCFKVSVSEGNRKKVIHFKNVVNFYLG